MSLSCSLNLSPLRIRGSPPGFLIKSGFTSELSQRRDFAGICVGWQVVELNLLAAYDVFLRLVGRPLLVARGVEDDQREDVNVPHPVNAREEGRRELQLVVLAPVPSRLGDLTEHEPDDRQKGAEQGGQHQELEAVDDAFVVEASHLAHGRQHAPLNADIVEDFPDHVAEEQEVDGSWDRTQNNERHLVRGEKWEKSADVSRKKQLFGKLLLTAILLPSRLTQIE